MTKTKPFTLRWRRMSPTHIRGYAGVRLVATVHRVFELGIFEVFVKNRPRSTALGWHDAKKRARAEWVEAQKAVRP